MEKELIAKKHLSNCEFVKVILMLLVVFGHSIAFSAPAVNAEDVSKSMYSLSLVYLWVKFFHVYAFALASGYIFAFKMNGGGYKDIGAFVKNKAVRLLVPYVAVMFLWIIPMTHPIFPLTKSTFVKNYLLGIAPAQVWFLMMLFEVFLIVRILWDVMSKKPGMGWFICISLYLIGIFGYVNFPNYFSIWTTCQYVLIFYAGARIRTKEEAGEKTITSTVPWFVWILIYCAIYGVFIYSLGKSGEAWFWMQTLLQAGLRNVGALMAWSCLQKIGEKFEAKKHKILRFLMYYTMPIYLFHQQITYYVRANGGRLDPWALGLLTFALSTLLALGIGVVLKMWKVTRFLIGEK